MSACNEDSGPSGLPSEDDDSASNTDDPNSESYRPPDGKSSSSQSSAPTRISRIINLSSDCTGCRHNADVHCVVFYYARLGVMHLRHLSYCFS